MGKDSADIIKGLAKEAGFDLVGITKAEHLAEASIHLKEWLSRGYHGTMKWMEANFEKRVDPDKVLSGARTVISLGKNYYTPINYVDGCLKISRYAWGDDYHVVLGDMLKKYVGQLQNCFPNNKFLHYCDTGPVMDKVWAQRAGIGWMGKHTNVINRKVGSWIFISEVISDLECNCYDLPEVDHCGTCRKCIDACPTEAIVEPYVLDANKCISYLTIENKEKEIPAEFSSKFDNWIFGCDICQEVCPWNQRFSVVTDNSAFLPREANLNLKAGDFHLISREEFDKKFYKSPVKRAKYEGFLRNIRAIKMFKEVVD
jgi:epoxyqueuosine reductase